MAVAGATLLVLPASVFQASAIVAVDETSAALRVAAARSAADLAVSKPVVARAAASLIGTSVPAPVPALTEKIGVATGLTGPTGAVARLADALVPTISARAGDGLVELQAEALDAARAAHVATALAEALVVEEEASIATAARRREALATTTLDTLREVARAAHLRLAQLGAAETDPADALATAGAASRTAEARVSAIRAVIAAGTPPLGAGTELPQTVAALQQTYWDLKKQLDKASETMGDRHTTVIALRDGVSRAAASLTAEWQRIERGAANDLAVARGREGVLRKAASLLDPARRSNADEARSAARLADAAVARASAPAGNGYVAPTFRLVAPAGVPAVASGLGTSQRASIAGGGGTAAFALSLLALARRRRGSRTVTASEPALAPTVELVSAVAQHDAAETAPVLEGEPLTPREIAEPSLARHDASRTAEARIPRPDPAATAPRPIIAEDPHAFDDAYLDPDWLGFEPDDLLDDDRTAAMPFEAASFDAEPLGPAEPIRTAIDRDLRDALRAIAADLALSAPGAALPATVMVAANATGADTGALALALGEAAAELGYRVLVIEAERTGSKLAEAVAPEGDPVLVDAFGALRVALPAERCDGLFLAPAFRDGARIAAALARNTQADLVDDLAAAFDAVVIDGGRAADAARAGWSAASLIRVGRFASQRDDAYFLEALDSPPEALIGTVAAGRFVQREIVPEVRPTARPALRAVAGSLEAAPAPRASSIAISRVPPRRRIVAR